MANEQNLIPLNKRTKSEQREIQSSGGIASGAARRRKRSLKEAADLYLSLPVTDKRILGKIKRSGVDADDIDNQMAIIAGLSKMAAMGDSRCAKVLFDLIGDTDTGDSVPDDGFVDALRLEAAEVWQED